MPKPSPGRGTRKHYMAPSSEGEGKRGREYDWCTRLRRPEAASVPLNQQRTRCVWVHGGASGQRGDAAESLVGCYEHANVSALL